jgi:tetratricopeptide (TPR) repeat protein
MRMDLPRCSLVALFLAALGAWTPSADSAVAAPGAQAAQAGKPSSAGKDTPEIAKEIERLNKLTGAEPMQGALKELTEAKDKTKKLIEVALPLTKEKERLSYNGAMVLALAAADQKDLKSAETLFRVCMNQAVKLQSARKLLQSYGALIDLFYENKQYDESARLCRELLELKTDDGKPRVVLTAFTDRFGNTDFNEDDGFVTAKRLRPGVHRLLIQTVTKQGKYDQALKLVETLLKTQDHWLDRELRARVLREAGKFDEAAKVYEDVLARVNKDKDLETDERDHYTERFRYILSNVYVDAKKIDMATKMLQGLLEQKPNDPGYNNDLGYIWADHDMNLDEAEKLIRKALELDEQRRKANKLASEEDRPNGAYLDSLGWVLYKKKQYKEAKDILLQAVEDKAAQHIEIYDHLGDVYLALGDTAKALEAWRKGLEVVGEGRREAERKEVVEKKIEKHKK